MPFEISVPEANAPVTSRSHRITSILAKDVKATQPAPRGWTALDVTVFEPDGGHPEEFHGREDHGELQEAQSNQQAQSAADAARGIDPRLLGLRTGVFPVKLGFLVPPGKGAYGYGAPYSILHTHGPL